MLKYKGSDTTLDGKEAYKFCLMGASFGTSNMGVSALAASMIKIIQDVHPDADVSLLIGNKSSMDQILKLPNNKSVPIKVVNFRLSPKAKLNEHLFIIFLMACLYRILPAKIIQNSIISRIPFLETVEHADFIGDIRGGDSFSDIYGLRRLVIGSMPAMIALLLRKKLILLPQTYGPYNSRIGRFVAKVIINRSTYILSRDKQGSGVVHRLTKNQNVNKEVIFCPDVAFVLDPIIPEDVEIYPPIDKSLKVPLVGFNINGLMYNGGYTRSNMFGLKLDYREFAKRMAVTLLKDTNSHILFIPHTYNPSVESDPDACIDIMNAIHARYKNRVHFVVREYDQSETKGLIGICDFFIGSRMHACIAALSQSVPAVGVAYSKKFKGIFESVGVGDMVIDGRLIKTEEAVNAVMGFFRDYYKTNDDLWKKVEQAKKRILKTFHRIL